MKSIFTSVAGLFGGKDGLINQVSGAIDRFVTTSGEKEQLKQETIRILQSHEENLQHELTERHRVDMNSDSWLSKNIRPLVLIFILVMYSLFSLTDGNLGSMQINEAYVALLGQWGMLIMSFYFGSRGVEKIMETVGKYKIGRNAQNKD